MRSESLPDDTSGSVTPRPHPQSASPASRRVHPGRTVANDPVELGSQLRDDLADALLGQRILVPGLRSRQQPQIFQPLVANEGLREVGNTLHHVDEIKDDAPFGAEHEIEVTQADVEVDHDDFFLFRASVAPSAAVVVVLPTPP